MDYKEYTKVLLEYKQKEEIHERLRQLVEGSSQVGISADAWQELDTNWQKVAAQVRHHFENIKKCNEYIIISLGSPLAMAPRYRTSGRFWTNWRVA